MKKYLIAIAMVLTLSTTAEAAAQKHRHTPRTEQVDSTKTNDAIEAFSDTTAVADTTVYDVRAGGTHVRIYSDEDVKGVMEQVFGSLDGKAVTGVLIVLGTLFILFVLFPIIIIIGVVYFINRNRKQRLKLAEMAMQNGQKIPENLLKEEAVQNDDDYRRGLRQMFTGVGLAIFLGIVAGQLGFGIGALVFFIGLGKWYIARQTGGTNRRSENVYNDINNNNSNIQNYDKETDAL